MTGDTVAHSNIIPLFDSGKRTAGAPSCPLPNFREALFGALDLGTGDGLLFTDRRFTILRIGGQAAEMHNAGAADLIGKDVRGLFTESGSTLLAEALYSLGGSESWAGELVARRMPDDVFPADVTIKRMPVEGKLLFCFVVRDLSETRRLRELLRQQRGQRREMYVTLRNLMRAFEKEKQGLERGIYHKITSMLLPSLEKIEAESSAAVRNSYVAILRNQLIDLTRGFSRELEGRFLTLTRSEIQVCRLIAKGLATKEVAERVNISFETVQTHRRNIRRKLGLNGRKISLHAYLADKAGFWQGEAGAD
jgi:DNA-binding CsgD family transcriptional regulator